MSINIFAPIPYDKTTWTRLRQTINAVCPIPTDIGTNVYIIIEPNVGATDAQIAAGKNAAQTFDWSDAATQSWLDQQQPERTALRNSAAQAISDNNTFLALTPPLTLTQVSTQLVNLTRQNNALIKRLVQLS